MSGCIVEPSVEDPPPPEQCEVVGSYQKNLVGRDQTGRTVAELHLVQTSHDVACSPSSEVRLEIENLTSEDLTITYAVDVHLNYVDYTIEGVAFVPAGSVSDEGVVSTNPIRVDLATYDVYLSTDENAPPPPPPPGTCDQVTETPAVSFPMYDAYGYQFAYATVWQDYHGVCATGPYGEVSLVIEDQSGFGGQFSWTLEVWDEYGYYYTTSGWGSITPYGVYDSGVTLVTDGRITSAIVTLY